MSKRKTVDIKDPYEVYVSEDGSWEWRVLKHYQNEENEAKNEFTRVMCAVKSPFTFDEYEYGDVYLRDILSKAHQVFLN